MIELSFAALEVHSGTRLREQTKGTFAARAKPEIVDCEGVFSVVVFFHLYQNESSLNHQPKSQSNSVRVLPVVSVPCALFANARDRVRRQSLGRNLLKLTPATCLHLLDSHESRGPAQNLLPVTGFDGRESRDSIWWACVCMCVCEFTDRKYLD